MNSTSSPGTAAGLNPIMDGDVQRLRREIAAMRSSYSWRLTAPLRKWAKPFMERAKG